jgi:arylsulfatase A-like enzyme
MDKPNLLFIFTDEQRFDTLQCYGNDFVAAPRLNALAEESFVFERAYVTQPICTPSRSTIMTGLYPHTTGCLSNNMALGSDTRTIAEMVDRDYARAYIGKWHLGDEVIPQHGFEHWVSLDDQYRAHLSKSEYRSRLSDYHHFLVGHGFEPDVDQGDAKVFSRPFAAKLDDPYTKATFVGQQTVQWLRENAGQPFACYVNMLEPHMPFTGPFDEMYDPDAIPTGPQFLQKPGENMSLVNRMLAEYFMQAEWEGQDLSTEAGCRKMRAQYLGLVTLVDRAVGAILDALEESGQADHTIVVFTSDHGDMMGDHGQFAKGVLYEEAVRVPLLLRVPWLQRERRDIGGNFSQIDLVPTLLDLLGERVPDGLQGQSRVPVLKGDEGLEGEDVFIEWHGVHRRPGPPFTTADEETQRLLGLPWRTVISADRWKLNLSAEDQCELFDLNTDPHEATNRFNDPDQQQRIRDLSGRITRWQQRTGDTVSLPEL